MAQWDFLPAWVRENGLFCCWKYETRSGSAKPTKVPYNPVTGGKAQSSNQATFAPFSVAVAAAETGQYDGIGLGAFGCVGAIDIDHCIDENFSFSQLAQELIMAMGSYAEISPSGTGVRILFQASEFQYDTARYYINNQKLGLEVYIAGCTNKYVTVTGNALGDMPFEERGEELKAVLERYMVRPSKPAPPPAPSPTPMDLDDLTLVQKAKAAANGSRFSDLWAGNASAYSSPSEADMALCNILAFWTGCDAGAMDRLFRQSGLMRDKWDRSQSGSTYGAITIQEAISCCTTVYDPQRKREQRKEDAVAGGLEIKPPDYSDAGNATVFGRAYLGELIFVDALGWLFWNGKNWERSDHQALARAIKLSEQMLQDALDQYTEALQRQAEAMAAYAETGDDSDKEAVNQAKKDIEKANAYLKHAKATRNATKLKAMLELSKPTLVKRADEMDANPFDLNTPGGIVDLHTGAIRPHDKGAYCTKITKAPVGTKGAQMWGDFLDTVTCSSGGIRGFLQLVAGMALIGTVYQEGIIIAHGGGRNGKSTMFNALGDALGDYSGSIDIKVITTDRNNKGASLATLRGKRLVVTGELEEHQRLSVATLKQIASTDMLNIEEKYRAPETVPQSHTLVLFTNHLPRVGSTDGGTWRRLIVVPFRATIPTGSGVQNFAQMLVEMAGPAILSWAVEGAVNFCRNGFKLDVPDEVSEATEEYRANEDWLGNFLNECCIREPNARIGARELYTAYRDWALGLGDYVRRESEFAVAMEGAGFQRITPKNRRIWVGVRTDCGASFSGVYSGANCG